MNHNLSSSVTCKNCGNVFTGNYCSNCGEKVYHDHDKSITHFFEDALHFITHLDGTLITTIKTIFTKPGQLSLDYCSGKRKKYFKPLSFFLLLVVLYLLFPLFEGLNMRLQYYPNSFGKFALNWIETKAASKRITEDELAELFAHKSGKWSKLLLLIIIPLSAFTLWLLHIRKRKYFFDHLVLSTEINSFFSDNDVFYLGNIHSYYQSFDTSGMAYKRRIAGKGRLSFCWLVYLFCFPSFLS